MVRLMGLLVAALFGGLVASPVQAGPDAALLKAAGLSAVSVPAPDFELKTHQGKPFLMKDQKGKVVFVNFWATWCPPCIHEMPVMETLYLELKDRPFTILALNMQEAEEDVARFMAKKGFKFPVLLDTEGEVAGSYKVRGLPSTYLIDCAGQLVGSVTGVLQWTHDATYALLEKMMSDKACQASSS